MQQKKINTAFWDKLRGVIRTNKGGLVVGEDVYTHGYSLLNDLVGNVSFWQVYVLNITGNLPSKSLASWLEAFFICMSYPDHRIWCNHIGSLAGSMSTSPVPAVSAGILASDSKMYGPGVVLATTDLLTKALIMQQKGLTPKEIVAHYIKNNHTSSLTKLAGFSRPVAKGDERVEVLDRLATELGFTRGDHLTLAFEIDHVLSSEYNETINLAGYSLAFLLDQDFNYHELYRICSALVQSGVLACYSEAYDNPAESFFPLRCEDIEYKGHPPRPVPLQNPQ